MIVLDLWFLSSLAGLFCAIYGVLEARADLAALAGRANGRRLVARQRLYAQLARTYSFTGYSLLGGLSVLANIEPQLNIATALLLTINFVQMTIVLSDVYTGRRLRTTYQDEVEKETQ